MTSALSNLTGYVYGLVSSFLSNQSEEVTLQCLHTFGPEDWNKYGSLQLEICRPPISLSEISTHSSPTSTDKKIEQTHILCCIPKGMSVAKLYEIAGKSTALLDSVHFQENTETYWCWVAITPVFKEFNFALQEQELKKVGCDVPTRLELMTVIYAARKLENMVLLSDEEKASIYKDGSSYGILGGDLSATFCGYQPCWKSVGTCSVIR